MNIAYERGDQKAIEKLIKEYGQDPEAIVGEDVASRIMKAIRRIAQLRRRMGEVQQQMDATQQTEIFTLKQTIEETEAMGGEAAAFVTDPLGAVPDLPFGHLHGAWERLKGNSTPGDEIWSFSAPWMEWSRKYYYSGYVIVHDGQIGAFWVTDYKPLDATT